GVVGLRPLAGDQRYGDELAQSERQSASLVAQLPRYDPDWRAETGRAAALAAELEDRIAAVDAELARLNVGAPADRGDRDLVKLWQDRVGLMQQLMEVHVTRASYVGL